MGNGNGGKGTHNPHVYFGVNQNQNRHEDIFGVLAAHFDVNSNCRTQINIVIHGLSIFLFVGRGKGSIPLTDDWLV